jgi:hypothetical protein
MSNRCDESDLRNWRRPTIAGDPPNRLAGARRFGMRTSQRPAKLRATATVQFAAN